MRLSDCDYVPHYAVMAREKKREQEINWIMRQFRYVPVAKRAWCVTLTATAAREDQFRYRDLVVGTEFQPQQFWLHARRVARRFVRADIAAGGTGSMFSVEYRRCKVCGRMMLAAEAQAYRRKERRPMRDWEYEFGPTCSLQCGPKKGNRFESIE